jgi:prepilin-type N-terminal cleavage/methylation domain-containing protein
MRSAKRPSLPNGFTLIEILISVFIVGTMIFLFGTVINTKELTREAARKEIALRIAKNKLEVLRAGGYDALPQSGAFSDSLLASLPSGTASTTVSAYNAKTKKVDVGVGWQSTRGAQYLMLTSLITNIGGL